jgi:hypothetical protein
VGLALPQQNLMLEYTTASMMAACGFPPGG